LGCGRVGPRDARVGPSLQFGEAHLTSGRGPALVGVGYGSYMPADATRPRPRMNGSQQALEQACATVGLDADGARLLRLGSNAVYHLKAPVIARILREVREFLMVTGIVSKAAEDARAAAESAKRITALRTGASRMDWLPS